MLFYRDAAAPGLRFLCSEFDYPSKWSSKSWEISDKEQGRTTFEEDTKYPPFQTKFSPQHDKKDVHYEVPSVNSDHVTDSKPVKLPSRESQTHRRFHSIKDFFDRQKRQCCQNCALAPNGAFNCPPGEVLEAVRSKYLIQDALDVLPHLLWFFSLQMLLREHCPVFNNVSLFVCPLVFAGFY